MFVFSTQVRGMATLKDSKSQEKMHAMHCHTNLLNYYARYARFKIIYNYLQDIQVLGLRIKNKNFHKKMSKKN